jgi:hypothetical protein
MALPTDKSQGPIRVSAIRQTFGGESPDGMGEYYKGGAYVDANDIGVIPAKGNPIKASDFYGARPANPAGQKLFSSPGIHEFIIPDYDTTISFDTKGGGGASGESAWDGPAPGHDPGQMGKPGQGSYVVGPDGFIRVGATQTAFQPNRGAPVTYLGEPEVGGAWTHGAAGQGGGGWPGVFTGAAGKGAVRNPEPNDIQEDGGGAAGGICPPYVGITTALGGPGGAGGRGKKVFTRGGPGSPKPGETWTLHVGAGGPVNWLINGKGADGSVLVEWA